MMKTSSTTLSLSKLALPVVFAGVPLVCLALPDDNQQPINIQSDRATRKTLEGSEKTEYFGNVVMTQGSMLINGDHVIIHTTDHKVTQITAIGKPAKFQQQSDPEKEPVKARADTIDYQLKAETVVLANNATIEQEGSTVSGNRIEYNVASERVQAEERVNMVFIPTSAKQDTDSGDNNSGDSNNKGGDVDTDGQ